MELTYGLLYINNEDVARLYGAFLTEDNPGDHTNYEELLIPPKMKPYVAVDFREDDGEKLPEELPNPAFEARDVKLYFAILADTPAQFLARYTAFIRLIKSGWLDIRVPELDKTYRMYYKDCPGYKQLTPIDGQVAAKFKVTFHEPKPVF